MTSEELAAEWRTIVAAHDELSILARHADQDTIALLGMTTAVSTIMLQADAVKWRTAIVLAHRERERERRAR